MFENAAKVLSTLLKFTFNLVEKIDKEVLDTHVHA